MQAETGYQKEKPKKQIQTAVLLATGCIGKTLDDFGGKTYAAAIPGPQSPHKQNSTQTCKQTNK